MAPTLSKCCPPLTWDSLLRHYVPATGAISYVLFSAHCLNPSGLPKMFPIYWHPISMGIWFNAHLGLGIYYYYRPHLRHVTDSSRIIYTAFSTVMFNFGSILFWGAIVDVVPRAKWLRVSIGVLTSICFLTVGREYVSYVDTLIRGEIE